MSGFLGQTWCEPGTESHRSLMHATLKMAGLHYLNLKGKIMKKVMLLVVGMLFSASSLAATMTWVSAPVIDSDDSSVQISAHEGYAEPEGAHTDYFVFNVDEEMSISAVAIEFFNSQIDIASVTLDDIHSFVFYELPFVDLAQWSLGNTLVEAGDHTIALVVNEAAENAQFDVKVSAVPIPAALFLFAPALLGFFGLRRKAAVAA